MVFLKKQMLKRFIIVMFIAILPFKAFTEEYSLKILGDNSIKELSVENEKLVLAETLFKWTDSDANFGKGFCLGSINSFLEKIELSFLCEFLDYEGEKFWTKIYRKSSELNTGIGSQKYIKTSKKYEKLLNKECKYAVSWFDKTSFLLEQKCNISID
ncbi:MAG: hypothetical protein CFH34_01506 [Alphaproteobacteria bacterium MarineAlpha9_Bin4]|nr:hypothetical protein [Pelagibacterales bacterium]PPR25272.1 MAG: hypothetical protein CFH34_01506 [Alphaproteobacteria bacterium MarineAlpha9_Bin4]|tara:strand:- start:220 stop:690 length:471 start_codon:yes stop_codon:yes gene_type:complete